MRSSEHRLFADYSQFYLQDEPAHGDLGGSWGPEASDRLVAVNTGIVGIGTVRNMDVPVVVEVHDEEPGDDQASWDHVVGCGLRCGSGRLVIAGCTDYLPDAARIEVTPGDYCVRVLFGALDTVSADGLDGDDHYRIQLWPGQPTAPRIVKEGNPALKAKV